MNNTLFFDDFVFTEFCFNGFKSNDNSAGINYHYIGYMREGSCSIVAGKKSFTVNEGDFFYLPKHFKYRSNWKTGKSGLVRFDSYGFKTIHLKQNMIYPPQAISPFETAIKLNEKLSKYKSVGSKSVGAFYGAIGLFYQLFGVLAEKMIYAPQERRAYIVQRAEEYMGENYHGKASEIARYCETSQTELYEAFKEIRGYTPVTAKHKIVVERAGEMLITTDMSIEEISAKLGFGNAAYFRKIFFGVTGKTPREFRKTTFL